ncbi:MAG: signal peptidase II [Pirellulales bacterium]
MESLPPVPLQRYILFASIAAIGCAADLATKSFAFSRLSWGQVHWVWPEHVGFQLSLNEGALFGMGQGKVWWFAVLSVVAAIAIPVWLFVYRAANDWLLTVALGAVTGGIFGNLYDRLGMHGVIWPWPPERAGLPAYAVRDWILWQYNDQWRWPNFNIADSLLVVGAGAILLRAMRAESPEKTQ